MKNVELEGLSGTTGRYEDTQFEAVLRRLRSGDGTAVYDGCDLCSRGFVVVDDLGRSAEGVGVSEE